MAILPLKPGTDGNNEKKTKKRGRPKKEVKVND